MINLPMGSAIFREEALADLKSDDAGPEAYTAALGFGTPVTSVTMTVFYVLLSFVFYLPVVLRADIHPMIGMLMLPKTCAYVWIMCMGVKAGR